MKRRCLHALCNLARVAAALALVCGERASGADPTRAPAPGTPRLAAADQPATASPSAQPAPSAPAGGQAPAQAGTPTAPAEPQPAPIPPPVVPVPEVTRPPNPDEVFSGHPVPPGDGEAERENAWFDTGRSFVGRLFFAPVVRLDRFFSDQSELDPERAQSFARVRGGITIREYGRPAFSGDVLAQVYMPGVESWLDRFRLVLNGISDRIGSALTADNGSALPVTAQRRIDPANLELRFGAYQGIRSSVDVGAGILFRYPPGAFARARYRLAVPIEDVMVSRTSYQVFWRTDMLLGTSITSALELPFRPTSMLRLGGSGQVAQRRTRGIEYGAELVYSQAFSRTFAVAFGTDAVGASRSPVAFDKYRIYARLRHDLLRRWLFVELQPEVGWPWTPDRGRFRALAALFRLEIQFQGDEAATRP